jgi:DNA polymerase III epsilon subunit-like protein
VKPRASGARLRPRDTLQVLDEPLPCLHDGVVRALADVDVLIVDCQTTGASPAFGVVLELGWGIVRASRAETKALQAHWILLPEGHTVPAQVRKLTGYDASSAHAAISESEAWQRLRSELAVAGAMPAAIHYARFELSFLRDWAGRLEPELPFPIDAVCVHAIALRLYPELPRHSLRALAGYLGHGLDLARRSLGHVEATAFVWRKMCDELAARGVFTWEQLQAWLAERAPSRARVKGNKYPIASERFKTLPNQPGVYQFLRSNGDVLYVGKASSLKKRVTSHFVGRNGTQQSPEMLTQVSDIQVTVAASALEAALLENETIKTLRPLYNVQLTANDPRVWYGTRDFDAAQETADERHPVGPLPSQYSLRPLAALTALLAGAPSTPSLRSSAVGVSALWTPDEAVFAAGFDEFSVRHGSILHYPGLNQRLAVLKLARVLLLSKAGMVDPETVEGAELLPPKSRSWDPERVARHLERAAAQAYQIYRRARWLALIHDSDILYTEPGSPRTRLLMIRDGAIADAKDSEPQWLPQARLVKTQALRFDRAKYDRLRILSSELKRIGQDGGFVAVHWGAAQTVSQRLVSGILRLV